MNVPHPSNRCAAAMALVLSVAAGGCDKSGAPSESPEPASEADAEPESASEAEAEEPKAAAVASVEPGAPGVPWADKTFKQRQEYMGITFFPEMRKAFKAYDGEAFAQFKCQTCHGDDMKEKNFEMPSESLYGLDPANPVEDGMNFDAELTKFMMDVVVPEGAKLLDMEPFNPETGEGFGCFGCHPKA